MNEPVAQVSEAEQRFDRFRQRAGLFVAPLVGLGLWLFPFAGLTVEAHRLLAILGAVITLWISEAIPLPVTALLGPTLCVLVGVMPGKAGMSQAREIFRGFSDPIIFLFLGSFLLAEAMLHHGLNRRIAFQILGLRGVGESPARVMAAFGLITGTISMWVSNTATTAMMFPIAVAILCEMARLQSQRSGREVKFTELRYGTGLMLMAAFASSVGGVATPVGTPPNLIGLGVIEKQLGLKISFFHWMGFGLPVAVVLIGFLIFYLNRTCSAEPGLMSGGARWIQEEKSNLGPLSAGERNVLLVFFTTVAFWVLPGVIAIISGTDAPVYKWMNEHLPEAMVSLCGACLLFVLPTDWRAAKFTLTWREATHIDWGTILLFGGGLALGDLMFSTGLARWIGEGLALALNARTTLGLVVLFTVVATVVSETTSNAASATMVVPVAIAVAKAAGVNPVQPALAACLGASMGFMLPVSTPPNAIVYGSGCVPLLKMVKYGLLLDLVAFLVIVPVTTWLVPLLLKM